jgi:hypothetical protein
MTITYLRGALRRAEGPGHAIVCKDADACDELEDIRAAIHAVLLVGAGSVGFVAACVGCIVALAWRLL